MTFSNPLASDLLRTFAAVKHHCCSLQLGVNVYSCHIGFAMRMSCQLERNIHICLSVVITSGTLVSHISDSPRFML